jgi:glutaminyl-peptide cyclotransferase
MTRNSTRVQRFTLLGMLILAATGCGAGSAERSAPLPVAPEAPPAQTTGGFDGQRAYAHVARLVAIGPRSPASEGNRRAQQYIQTTLKSYGCPVEAQDFGVDTPVGHMAMKNLLVKIPGASPNIILLATHYDTVRIDNFVGADDGGSSTGVMLELARLLCPRKNAVSIWIAFFDGEEAQVVVDGVAQWTDTDSRYGSREMAARMAAAGELPRVKAMLLADIVGSRDLRIKRESSSTPWLKNLVWSVAKRLGYANTFVSDETETAIEDDHDSFLSRGVPATDVIDLDVSYWHTTGDTLDKLSPRSLAIVGHVFIESVGELDKKFR